MAKGKNITFEEAKEALVSYFKEENIEDFGFTKEEFNKHIADYNSPLYDVNFLRETALCFDFLTKNSNGFLAE